jgi:formate dehydrogenase alpha subunit
MNSGKIKITIDGKLIEANKNDYIIQIARENGIMIPGLCFHRKLTPTGACRLCLVKISGMNGLQTSCSVKATDGMIITAFDEDLEHKRKKILELLFAEHNLDDDGSFEDEFHDLLSKYDITENDYYKSTRKIVTDFIDYSSPVLRYDSDKCIKCFRCIKACSEVQGKNVLSFGKRGIRTHIIAGKGIWSESECDGCGECIQLCPTGAIVEKPHRSVINLKKVQSKITTTCPYCGVGCQLELWVQDGVIRRVTGVEGVLPNDGRLCVKGRFGYDFVNSTERLKTPLIRKNGKLTEATWDEAIELIASRFTEIKNRFGSDSLAGYSSAKCTNEENYLFQKFIRIAFENNNVDYCTRLCHASTVTAMLKAIGDGAGSNSIEDFEKTDCLFVTGNNIIETHPVTATYVKRGYARGMKIIVVDPKWTPLVKYADVWLQPRLGTDVALLNGLIHIIIRDNLIDEEFILNRVYGGLESFDQLKILTKKYTPNYVEKITAIESGKLIRAAHLYAKAKTAMIATGMGMSQQVTGTNNVFALLNMCFISGKIGKELCGINPPRGQNNVQGATDVGASPINYPGYIPVTNEDNRRKVAKVWNIQFEKLNPVPGKTTVEIMKAVHDKKIRALYVMGENPVITDPNLNHVEEALNDIDFLVVQDIFLTETAKFAHVVLPASSFAEKDGTFVNSDRRVLRVRKAVEMPGDAKEDWKIILEIAKKMNVNIGSYNSPEEIFEEIRKVTPIMAGISYSRIEKQGIQWPCIDEKHSGTSTLFLDKFNTPHGKAVLFPVDYFPQNEKTSAEYPFILNSGRMLYQYHSATMSRKNEVLNDFASKHFVLINPDDALKFNFLENEEVLITSKRGQLKTNIRISDEVAHGEIFMPWHFHESRVNKLTRDELDPLSKIAPFKLSACRIEKIFD